MMKKITLFTSLVASAMLSPILMAQIPMLVPAPVMVQPSAKQFSSNAVRAIFRGFKQQESSPTLSDMLTPPAPNTPPMAQQRIAIFEVIESLAYKRLSPYASKQLEAGELFKVELDIPLLGQSEEITEMVKNLQVGEEVVAKLDELFVFDGQQQGRLTTPLVRMVRRNAPPQNHTDVIPAPNPTAEIQAVDPADATPQPIQGALPMPQNQSASNRDNGPIIRRNTTSNSSFVSVRSVNGVTETVQVQQERLPGTNEVRTRMFINGVEVDPQTKQPLSTTPAAPATPNEPAPSPVVPEDETAPPAEQPVQKVEPLPVGTTF